MSKVKVDIQNIEKNIANAELAEFCKLLLEHLPDDELSPQGFVVSVLEFINNLKSGFLEREGYEPRYLLNPIVGMHEQFNEWTEIVIKATTPLEFSEEVMEYFEKIKYSEKRQGQ